MRCKICGTTIAPHCNSKTCNLECREKLMEQNKFKRRHKLRAINFKKGVGRNINQIK